MMVDQAELPVMAVSRGSSGGRCQMKAFLGILFLLTSVTGAYAADWPMWRYDATRSAASPDEIAATPVLLWSMKLPPVRQAWPLEPNQRINFDASYEPVAMGKLLFVSSPNDGSITAYDTDTGAEKWTFFTEGPVRCAPVCYKNKIYAGSDDGCLYCLDARTGALVWKFRGAPEDRPDRRQLGNGHLVSLWPVRGGPVVKDDIVYFGAGIWPIFGIFLYALDAETGKVKWNNGDLNYIASPGMYTSDPCDIGLSPQGYFALIRDKLVVPCGRSLPAEIDAVTGKLIYYYQGGRRGESRVALYGDYAFVGRDAVINLKDFREVGPSLMPGKLVAGCDASSAFAENGVAYGSVNGAFYAYDVGHAKEVERESKDPWGTVRRMERWEPPVRWQYQTRYAGQVKIRDTIDGRPWGYDANPNSGIIIKAGKRLYGAMGKQLLALDNLGGPPQIVWEKKIDGTPSSLIAADNKLFVATAEGAIFCFGEGNPVKASDPKPAASEARKDLWSEKAGQIIKASGMQDGYCLVLGVSEGRLVDELLAQSGMIVLAVDADAKKIDVLRRRYSAGGLLGSRVELFVANPFEFLFPPYIASLIVSEDAKSAGFPTAAKADRLFNVLHPYGGMLCLDLPADMRPTFDAWALATPLKSATAKSDGNFSLLIRDGPLPGSASWTHLACDAANTYCSQDDLVKAPLGFLWYGDATMIWPEYPFGTITRFAMSGGRVYHHGARGNNFLLNVYDAYTGRSLWSKTIPNQCRRASSVMMPGAIYFVADNKCIVFDPKTGEELKIYPLTTEAQVATDLRVTDDVILVMCTQLDSDAWHAVLPGYMDDVSSTLICLDRKTGAELLRRTAKERFHSFAIAAGGGMIFAVDSMPLYLAEKTVAKPEDLKKLDSTVLALEARTGNEKWSKKITYDATRTLTQTDYTTGVDDGHHVKPYGRDWLSYDVETDTVIAGRYFMGSAFEVGTGTPRWENKEIHGTAPMVIRDRAIVTSGGRIYDILTGELKGTYEAVRKVACNYAVASKHLFMIRLDSASYYDVGKDKSYTLRNIRPSCMNNLIAADGLVNSPCFTPGSCICNYAIQTSFAMMPMPEVEAWSGSTPLKMTPPPARTAGSAPDKEP